MCLRCRECWTRWSRTVRTEFVLYGCVCWNEWLIEKWVYCEHNLIENTLIGRRERRMTRSHGVMVSTQDSESCNPSSNLGGTFLFPTFYYAVHSQVTQR